MGRVKGNNKGIKETMRERREMLYEMRQGEDE